MGRRRRSSSSEDSGEWVELSSPAPTMPQAFPFQGKALYSCLTAMLIFVGCQWLLLWQDTSRLDDLRQTAEEGVRLRDRRIDAMRVAEIDKDRQIFRLERRMRDLEQRVKSQHARRGGKELRTIYFVTPTYARPTQRAELTRLAHTLMHVANLFWVVVEDTAGAPSHLVADILSRSGLKYAHLTAETPERYRTDRDAANWLVPRGVAQRNAGLAYLRTNMAGEAAGNALVYFGDDDNTYDLRLFDEIRKTRRLGVWPVGLVGGLMVERPQVNGTSGSVARWGAGWRPDRPFAIDMAAFAVSLRLLLRGKQEVGTPVTFSYDVPRGHQESHLLTGLGLSREDAEPLADNCTKVYVWHTRTEQVKLKSEAAYRRNNGGHSSDDGIEV